VTLDGTDLREYEVESFRSLLGIVEQDVFLFDGTIAQNIAYARRDATAEEIRAAAAAANSLEFIEKLTDGMQTIIGERGVRLSGGQRQRLAIARALALQPALLILDESLSGLDLVTQAQILNLLADIRITHSLAYLLITHDLGLVGQVADYIAVMHQGTIVDQGTMQQVFGDPQHTHTRELLAATWGLESAFQATEPEVRK
jgi:ABC-type multidrug transport system fused ATPase/permease subunit